MVLLYFFIAKLEEAFTRRGLVYIYGVYSRQRSEYTFVSLSANEELLATMHESRDVYTH